jgi:small subunit ribosomal protein S2
MSVVSMRELLEAGVHFGHQTRRWNPKMKKFILSQRNGIYIIDIQQSIAMLESAYQFVRETVGKGGTVMFIGTKKQAQEPVAEQAQRVGMPYVNHRWLGGMLTNFETIRSRLERLTELEEMERDGTMEVLPKKEVLALRREMDKLMRNLGGVRGMDRLPSAVWVVDTVKEEIAVKEANRLGIPVVAVVDTNCDPDVVDYLVPGNDDAIRSGALLTRLIADACAEGHVQRASRTTDEMVAEQAAAASGEGESEAEPLAEWEIALQREEAREAAKVASGSSPPTDDQPADDQRADDTTSEQAAATDSSAEATPPAEEPESERSTESDGGEA